MKINKYNIIYPLYDKFTLNQRGFYKFLKYTDDWDNDIIKRYHLSKLKTNLGIDTWGRFYNLPVTTKKDLITPKVKTGISHETSGSTGEPREIIVPKQTWARKDGVFMKSWEDMGWQGEKVFRLIAGDPKYADYDFWRNVYPVNYRNDISELADSFIEIKPKLIHGPGGSIRQVCEEVYSRGRGDLLEGVLVQWCSESWENHYDRLCALRMKPSQQYGLAELPTVVRPDKPNCKNPIHVWQTGILEILDQNNNHCKENEEGDIVVTDIFNNIMPIIRYRTGDRAKYIKDKNGIKRLYHIKGRGVDYYNGPEVKRPVGWWLVSPISHNWGDLISKWRVTVNIPKRTVFLHVVPVKEKISEINRLQEYDSWIRDNLGLPCTIIVEKDGNDFKRKLVEVITR